MRILLWGTYDTGKPRLRILRDGLKDTPGVDLAEIHVSVWEGIEDKSQVRGIGRRLRLLARWLLSYPSLVWRLLRAPRPDLLLVGYPGILDVFAALPIARLRRIPIAWDVFISLYDTICHDRHLLSPSGLPGRLLRWIEGIALRGADIVFMDTSAHARHVERLFSLADGRCGSVWVGAETEHFPGTSPTTASGDDTPMQVLFYGQFIPLHGIDTIIHAARRLQNEPIEWRIIGSGQVADRIRGMLAEDPLPRVQWLAWVDYGRLAHFIADSDLCLGIFGTSAKAANVIPNKVFQIVAAGRPLVTRDSPAIRELLSHSPPETYLVPPGDPDALACAVLDHLRHRSTAQMRQNDRSRAFGKAAIARQFLALIKESAIR